MYSRRVYRTEIGLEDVSWKSLRRQHRERREWKHEGEHRDSEVKWDSSAGESHGTEQKGIREARLEVLMERTFQTWERSN